MPRAPDHLLPGDKKGGWKINLALAAGMAAIFAIDVITPLGIAVPFLYLLLALMAIAVGAASRCLLAIAVLGPLLALLKILLYPNDGVFRFGEANRLIFLLLIWAAIGVEWMRRQLEARREENSRQLERLVAERTEALHAANSKLEAEIAERKQAEATVTDYAQRLEALASQLVDAQEAERKALATELHDRIGQNLSALNLGLNLALAQLAASPAGEAAAQARLRLRDALGLVEQTTEIVRGVMEELHPALLEQYGLAATLHWYGEEFARRTGIALEQTGGERFPRLRGKVEMALFRIAQEALTNVAKHAAAATVGISLSRMPAGVELAIVDDGGGLSGERVLRPGGGWGLAIMGERARSVGGVLRIEAGAPRGTRIAVFVPDGSWENV